MPGRRLKAGRASRHRYRQSAGHVTFATSGRGSTSKSPRLDVSPRLWKGRSAIMSLRSHFTLILPSNAGSSSRKYSRNCAYNVVLRHLGMETTWYLHSHLVSLTLSNSSIRETPPRMFGGSLSGVSAMDPLKRQTCTAPPAEAPPGGSLDRLTDGRLITIRTAFTYRLVSLLLTPGE